MRLVHSVSFKKSEVKLMEFALRKDGFSEYIKRLIYEDKVRAEHIFTKEEKVEIERIIDEKLVNLENDK